MKREILFRAKGSGKWRYGSYLHFDKKPINDCCNNKYKDFIVTNGMYGEHYYPITELSSLGQYTGLKDKNGDKIFEGDIIKCTRGCLHEVYIEKEYGGTYFGGMPAVYLKGLREGYAWTEHEEILGNIYENPELLEGKE